MSNPAPRTQSRNAERQNDRDQARERRRRRRNRHQGPVAVVLLVLVGVLIVLAGPVAYIGGLIRNENKFVDLTDQVIDNQIIRQQIATQTADIVVETVSNNQLVQSLPPAAQQAATNAATEGVSALTKQAGKFLDNPTVVTARDKAFRGVHRQLTSDEPGITIDLTETVSAIANQVVSPPVALLVDAQVRSSNQAVYTLVEPDSSAGRALDLARKVPSISRWLTVVWMVLVGLAIGVSRRRQRTTLYAGITVVAASVATVFVMLIGINQGTSSLNQAAIINAAGKIVVWDYARSLWFPVVVGAVLIVVGAVMPRRSRA